MEGGPTCTCPTSAQLGPADLPTALPSPAEVHTRTSTIVNIVANFTNF